MATKLNYRLPTCLATEMAVKDGKKVSFEAYRLDKPKCNLSDVVSACATPTANRKAALVSQTARAQDGFDAALYVVAPSSRSASKIGFTTNPFRRLESLQCAHHEQLNITHLFWLPQKAARGVEMLTLRVLGRMGVRLHGEWCSLDPEGAASAIAAVALQGKVPLATSALYVINYRRMWDVLGGPETSNAYWMNPEQALKSKRRHLGIDV